jgi:hypothetical protein
MTREDFLAVKSDSSASSNSEQHRKLTKKQAKKMARENRNNQDNDNTSPTDDNDKLVQKIEKITLQSTSTNHDEEKTDIINNSGKIITEEKEDKVADMPKVTPRPTVYRRHMSESQVEVEPASNGEFKLKVYELN